MPDEAAERTNLLSKVIRAHKRSGEKTRWEKYCREKLADEGDPLIRIIPDASQVVDPARIEAEARTEAERIKQEAFETGFAQGRDEGLKKTASEVQNVLAFFRNLAASLKEEEQKILNEIEPDVVKLAVSIAERIVGREVAVDRQIVKGCVARAVEKIVERERLIIYVNPVDLPTVVEYKAELMASLDGIKEIEVVASENGISPGGCAVETDLLKVNGKIEAQLEEILRGLLE